MEHMPRLITAVALQVSDASLTGVIVVAVTLATMIEWPYCSLKILLTVFTDQCVGPVTHPLAARPWFIARDWLCLQSSLNVLETHGGKATNLANNLRLNALGERYACLGAYQPRKTRN